MDPTILRLASTADLPVLFEIDAEIAPPSELAVHREYYQHWVDARECFLAHAGTEPVGLAVLHQHFFHAHFIELLLVRPRLQGKGLGRAILQGLLGIVAGAQVWTSTNRSNARMQGLLTKEGFTYSGSIEGLDEGDPELFYRRNSK